MTKLKYLLFIILLINFSSCIKPEKVETVEWEGNTIKLSVINGGATTSYLYKIYYKRKWMLGKDRLVFLSYSTPAVKGISVENNNLTIDCFAGNKQTNRIIIDLNDIDEYIGSPIKYRRDVLEKTNEFYDEPSFIKRSR